MAKFSASVKINVVSNLGKVSKQISKNVSKMKAGFSKLTATIKKATSAFGKFSKRAGLAAVAVTIAIGALIKKVADFGDRIDKTSQKTGILADELQRLQYAARIGGASTDDFNRSVRFLARAVSEAGDGMAEYEDEFEKLGITVRDQNGVLKEPIDIMNEMADAFSVMEDGGFKSARAMSILGRSGEALIPMLNMGAEGIKKIGQEVEFPITDEMADDAATFNDKIEKLVTNIKGLTNNAIAPALTVLSDYIDKLNAGLVPLQDWITENVNFKEIIDSIANALKNLDIKEVFEVSLTEIRKTIDDLSIIVSEIASVIKSVKSFKSKVSAPFAAAGAFVGETESDPYKGYFDFVKGSNSIFGDVAKPPEPVKAEVELKIYSDEDIRVEKVDSKSDVFIFPDSGAMLPAN